MLRMNREEEKKKISRNEKTDAKVKIQLDPPVV